MTAADVKIFLMMGCLRGAIAARRRVGGRIFFMFHKGHSIHFAVKIHNTMLHYTTKTKRFGSTSTYHWERMPWDFVAAWASESHVLLLPLI